MTTTTTTASRDLVRALREEIVRPYHVPPLTLYDLARAADRKADQYHTDGLPVAAEVTRLIDTILDLCEQEAGQ